jgi:hypothetical protein
VKHISKRKRSEYIYINNNKMLMIINVNKEIKKKYKKYTKIGC